MQDKNSEEIIKSAQDFIVQIVEFPTKDTGGLLVGRIDFWKFRNKLSMVLITKKLTEKLNSPIKKVSPDIIISLLESAGKREDPKVLKMFASLLFGHINAETSPYVHKSYSFVLEQLSVEDVKIIETMYMGISAQNIDYKTVGYSIETAMKLFSFLHPVVLLSYQNLWRLGICDRGVNPSNPSERQIIFTDYGWQFMKACSIIE